MKRALKWVFGILRAVIILVVAAVIIFTASFDPSAYKPRIEQAVQEKTGRTLKLAGDISVSVFPWIGVEIGEFSLSNPPGFGDAPFVRADKAGVRVKLMPLLGGDVLVKGVELTGLNAELITLPDGRTNWDFSTAETKQKEEKKVEKTSDGQDDPFIKSLFVGEVAIKNARILWDDRKNNQKYEIKNLEMITGALTPGEPFDATLGLNYAAGKPDMNGSLNLSGRFDMDPDNTSFSAQGLSLTLGAGGSALPFDSTQIQLTGNAEYKGNSAKVQGLDLIIDAQGGSLKKDGSLHATLSGDAVVDMKANKASVTGLNIKGDLNGADPAMKAVVELASALNFGLNTQDAVLNGLKLTASAEGDQFPGGKVNADLNADRLALGLKSGALALDGLKLNAMGAAITGEVTGSDVLSSPKLSGTLNAPTFNLRSLLTKLGTELDMQDPAALTAVGLSSGFKATEDSVSLDSLKLGLDGSNLSGSLGVRGFKRPIPALSFRLKGDSLDADRYLPPKKADSKTESDSGSSGGKGGSSGKSNEELIPVETLRKLDIDGTLAMNQFKINNLRMTNVNVEIKAAGGKLDIRPLKLSLYEGGLSAAMSMDASGSTPRTTVTLDLSTFNLRPFLKDLTGKESIGGKLAVKTALDASGAKLNDILAGLNGNFAMNLKDCDIDKADRVDNALLLPLQIIGNTIKPLVTALSTMKSFDMLGSLPRLSGSEDKLASVTMDAAAKSGMVSFNTLEVLYPYMRINGQKGTMNLKDMTLNYPFTAKVVKSGAGQSADQSKETAALTIPVNCRGSLNSPTCVPDPTAIIKGVLSQPMDSPQDLLDNLGSAFGVGGKKKTEESTSTTTKSTTTETQKTEPKPVKQMENLIKGIFN